MKSLPMGAIPIVAHHFSNEFAVNFHFNANKARTIGNTIYLPNVPPDQIGALWGYVINASARIKFVESQDFNSSMERCIAYVFEDVMAERKIIREYPGTVIRLTQFVEYAHSDCISTELPFEELFTLFCALWGRGYVLNQPVKGVLSILEPFVLSYPFGQPLIELFKSRYHLLSNSSECLLLARDVVNLVVGKQDDLNSQDDQEQQEPQSDQDSSEDQEGQGDQESSQDQESQGDQESSQDEDGQGDQESGQDEDSQGDQDSGQDQESQGDQDSGQDQETQGDQDSGQDQDSQGDQSSQAKQDIPSDNSSGWILPLDKGALFEHQDGSFDNFCSIPTPKEIPRFGFSPYKPKRSQGAGLRQRLISLFKSDSQVESLGLNGKVNHRKLARISVGDFNVFNRRFMDEDVKTGIHILLDMSDSMSRRGMYKIAQDAVYDVSDAMQGTDLNYSITVFKGDEDLYRIKDYKQNLNSVKSRLGVLPDGSTPMAEALWYAAMDFANNSFDRNIILVVTDGEPNSISQVQTAVRHIEKSGIEIYAIGIEIDSVKQHFRRSTVINHVDQLKDAFTSILKSIKEAA